MAISLNSDCFQLARALSSPLVAHREKSRRTFQQQENHSTVRGNALTQVKNGKWPKQGRVVLFKSKYKLTVRRQIPLCVLMPNSHCLDAPRYSQHLASSCHGHSSMHRAMPDVQWGKKCGRKGWSMQAGLSCSIRAQHCCDSFTMASQALYAEESLQVTKAN